MGIPFWKNKDVGKRKILRLTTSLTIYRLGLRGNNAHKSTRKHRFWTQKPLKSPEITQKIYAYAFGTLRLQDRIFFSQNHQKSLEPSGFQGFSIFSKKCPKITLTTCFDHLWKNINFNSYIGTFLRLNAVFLSLFTAYQNFKGWARCSALVCCLFEFNELFLASSFNALFYLIAKIW